MPFRRIERLPSPPRRPIGAAGLALRDPPPTAALLEITRRKSAPTNSSESFFLPPAASLDCRLTLAEPVGAASSTLCPVELLLLLLDLRSCSRSSEFVEAVVRVDLMRENAGKRARAALSARRMPGRFRIGGRVSTEPRSCVAC